jgi:hypothetical protein
MKELPAGMRIRQKTPNCTNKPSVPGTASQYNTDANRFLPKDTAYLSARD